jgi:tetratricopeptide (TPR) repeat protein/DNA-binding CsgD family transcriptional regulator
MRNRFYCFFVISLLLISRQTIAQSSTILSAQSERRLPLLWKYCTTQMISDQDSVTAHRFFDQVISGADELHDIQLKVYAQYFKRCWRIFFSERYEAHFSNGDYASAVDLLTKTQKWALAIDYPDVVASCDYFIGEIYYRANRYGLAFEHFFRASAAFRKIGYAGVSNISTYLYTIGLHFYQFEEFDKALQNFLQATQTEFIIPRIELNTLNAIGLIYDRSRVFDKAARYFRSTITKAVQYNDSAWIGIGAGNLGNLYLEQNKNDSALFYHRINYAINSSASLKATEDAAKTALSLATIFLRKNQPDSALHYVSEGKKMAALYITDTAGNLDYKSRWQKVMVQYLKNKEDYRGALALTDSLFNTKERLRRRMDGNILNRAMEKTEAALYDSRLTLMQSQKDFVQVRTWFIMASVVLILLISAFFYRDRWLRKQREVRLAEKDNQILMGEKLRAEEGLKHSQELLKAYVDMVKEKTILIEHLETELTVVKQTSVLEPDIQTVSANTEKLRASTILTDSDWQQFRKLFEQVYPGFSHRVKENYPALSPAENRLLFLTKLKLSSREMAAMLGVSLYSVHKLRYRVRKKLDLDEEASFDAVIQKIN